MTMDRKQKLKQSDIFLLERLKHARSKPYINCPLMLKDNNITFIKHRHASTTCQYNMPVHKGPKYVKAEAQNSRLVIAFGFPFDPRPFKC